MTEDLQQMTNDGNHGRRQRGLVYELLLRELPTLVNVKFAFVPSVVIAPMHTTMIRASITAYSTAVGPSSLFKKSTIERARRENMMGYSFLL
jgi:hypothetical protein